MKKTCIAMLAIVLLFSLAILPGAAAAKAPETTNQRVGAQYMYPLENQKTFDEALLERAMNLKLKNPSAKIKVSTYDKDGKPFSDQEKTFKYEVKFTAEYAKSVYKDTCTDEKPHDYQIECQINYYAELADKSRDLYIATVNVCEICGSTYKVGPDFIRNYEK